MPGYSAEGGGRYTRELGQSIHLQATQGQRTKWTKEELETEPHEQRMAASDTWLREVTAHQCILGSCGAINGEWKMENGESDTWLREVTAHCTSVHISAY